MLHHRQTRKASSLAGFLLLKNKSEKIAFGRYLVAITLEENKLKQRLVFQHIKQNKEAVFVETPNSSMAEKEYMMLREELTYNQKLRDSLEKLSYTVAVGIFAATVTLKNPWVILCNIVFLFLMSFRVAECARSVAYLSSYIYTNIESADNFRWETQHYEYSKQHRWKGIEKAIYSFGRWNFIILSGISAVFFWFLRGFNFYIHGHWAYGLIMIILQMLAIFTEIYLIIVHCSVFKHKTKMIKNWKNLQINTDTPNNSNS